MVGKRTPMVAGDTGYRCWLRSHRGLVRPNNEDACAVSASPGTPELWHGMVPAETGWALIADGMGGHAAGEVASRLALESLRTAPSLVADEAAVREAVAAAHRTLFAAMREETGFAGMGTTVAGAILRGEDILAFNVGGSRIYQMGATLSLVSEDHVIHRYLLTRCLGGTNAFAAPEPYVARLTVRQGERLLLCTDGLTDMVGDARIERLLTVEGADPAKALVDAALAAGGVDYVSVIVLERLA